MTSICAGSKAARRRSRRSPAARRYRDAGCDGLFAPCIVDAADIKAVASAVAPLPLNVMLMPDLPAFDALPALGVRRLSCGSAIAEAALGHARELALSLLAGKVDEMYEVSLDYGAANELFAER